MEQELENTNANTANYRNHFALTFGRGLQGNCDKIEGEFKIFYYNGPLKSNYGCASGNGDSGTRKLLILEDIEFSSNPLNNVEIENETLTIRRVIPKTPAEAEPNMWTYSDIKIEKEEETEYPHSLFKKRMEISYVEETHQ